MEDLGEQEEVRTIKPRRRLYKWGRLYILAKTNECCLYCGVDLHYNGDDTLYSQEEDGKIEHILDPDWFTVDHFIADSAGGLTNLANSVPCCRSCNSKKGDRSAYEFAPHLSMKADPSCPACKGLGAVGSDFCLCVKRKVWCTDENGGPLPEIKAKAKKLDKALKDDSDEIPGNSGLPWITHREKKEIRRAAWDELHRIERERKKKAPSGIAYKVVYYGKNRRATKGQKDFVDTLSKKAAEMLSTSLWPDDVPSLTFSFGMGEGRFKIQVLFEAINDPATFETIEKQLLRELKRSRTRSARDGG